MLWGRFKEEDLLEKLSYFTKKKAHSEEMLESMTPKR